MLYARYEVDTQRISMQKFSVASFTMRTLNAFILAASFLVWTTILAAPPPGPHTASIQLPGLNLTLPFNATEARPRYAPFLSIIDPKQDLT